MPVYNEMQLSSFVDRMGAMRRYREATGVGMAEAQEAVAKL